MKKEASLRALQTNLPWTVRYSQDFRANPQSHKDFAHAVLHAVKAVGRLSEFVDDMDHDRSVADEKGLRDQFGVYVADLVVCALRAANTYPGGVLDLNDAVIDRIETKNNVKLMRGVVPNPDYVKPEVVKRIIEGLADLVGMRRRDVTDTLTDYAVMVDSQVRLKYCALDRKASELEAKTKVKQKSGGPDTPPALHGDDAVRKVLGRIGPSVGLGPLNLADPTLQYAELIERQTKDYKPKTDKATPGNVKTLYREQQKITREHEDALIWITQQKHVSFHVSRDGEVVSLHWTAEVDEDGDGGDPEERHYRTYAHDSQLEAIKAAKAGKFFRVTDKGVRYED